MHHVLSAMQDVQSVSQQQQQQQQQQEESLPCKQLQTETEVHQDGLYLLRSFAASRGRLLLQGEPVEHRETEG